MPLLSPNRLVIAGRSLGRLSGLAGRSLGRLLVTALAAAALIALVQILLAPSSGYAQKPQTDFGDKLHWGTETAGVSVACSADGKYVYVAGPEGVVVSSDFGKTGTWSLVLKGK